MRRVDMKTITVRGVDPDLDRAIKSRAEGDSISVNQWVLKILKKATGMEKEPLFRKHQDLDELAGGWTKEDAAAFQKNTQIFEKIDEDVWK
jgi:plasmid stability protein